MRTTTRSASPFRGVHGRTSEGVDGRLLRAVAARIEPADLRLCLGSATVRSGSGPPVATIRFKDRRAVASLALDPVRRFGDAYSDGRIEVEGDLVAALASVYRALEPTAGASLWARLGTLIPHGLLRDREAVHHHYDLGNDFYRLWLDDQMLYTCAYFHGQDQTLEAAQVAKMDLVCRKLGLQPGETVVEAGCGWGALALHMAKRYGVHVRAYNVSTEQIAWARAQAEREGLGGRVTFLQKDYREIDGRCDAFVSIGMLEHVGRGSYGALARVIERTLDVKRGRGLLHFIGRDWPQPLDAWIRRRIFPRAYPPTLDESCRGVLVPARMSVVDVENLRPHYALTLWHWRDRYERALREKRVSFDERFHRMWRLYLAGSEAAFLTGWLQLFQVVFAPSGTEIPASREPLYHAKEGWAWNAPTS